MGFYLRKSVRVGPFRFNLSKSGIGVSAGVKGLRVGTGPRGHYIHAGRGGFYYRESLGNPKRRSQQQLRPDGPQRREEQTPFEDVVVMQEIESGSVLEMVDSSSAQLLSEIRGKHQRLALAKPSAFVLGAVLLILLSNGVSAGIIVGALVVSVLLIAALMYWDIMRKTVVLMYDLEPEQATNYKKLHEVIENLMSCAGTWHISAQGNIRDVKRNAGATTAVSRKAIQIKKTEPPFITTNIDVPAIPAGAQTLYFFPDRILIFEKGDVGAVSYSDVELNAASTRFVEEETVPGDAQVLGRTWKYVNKKGGPDRRFKGNREIPICLYEDLQLRSSSGLNERFSFSRAGVSEPLRQLLQELQQVPLTPR